MSEKAKKRSRKSKDLFGDIKQRFTDKEVNDLAQKIVSGQVFTDRHIREGDQNLVGTIFMPLIFMKPNQIRALKNNPPAMVYADYKNTMGSRSINGYPSFGTVVFVWHQEDVEKVFQRVKEINEFMNSDDKKIDDPGKVEDSLSTE